MGKIQAGILSKVSGKIAGVVGGSWKDKAYLRAYVIPANPNTAAQQVQRTKFSDVVEFCKPLVGQVFNSFTDKFIKNMSGFNFFIKRNIAIFDGTPDYTAIKVTEGPLSAPTANNTTYSDPDLTINWYKTLGNNGSDTDQVSCAVYNNVTGIWSFSAAPVARNLQTIDVDVGTGVSVSELEVYLWCGQYIGTVLDKICNSYHDTY